MKSDVKSNSNRPKGKIVYVSASQIPSRVASAVHVMKMCQGFKQQNYDVVLFAPRNSTNAEASLDQIHKDYGLTASFPIVFLEDSARGWGYALRTAWRLHRDKPDVVYCRSILGALVAALMGQRLVYEAHELPKGKLGSLYFKILLRTDRAFDLVVITNALRRMFVDALPPWFSQARILVAPDAVDAERFEQSPPREEAKRKLGLDGEQFVAGYAGHLYPGRGGELMLRLAKKAPWVTFLLAGGDPGDIDRLQRMARQDDTKNVRFLGFLPNEMMPDILAAADVLLMPYQKRVTVRGAGNTADWCSPMKMFEYLAAGRIIISSNLVVLQEVLEHEKNAVLCEPDDEDEWLAALEKAKSQPEWRAKIERTAKIDAQRFTWKNRVKTVLKNCTI